MEKFCIFCGLKPQSKNKEHIIPQWLIKMTGDPKRQINLGADTRHHKKTGESKLRTFSFDQFQFPACEECNYEFAALESRVKGYFERLFQKDYFTNLEIDDLLDWFDKVRIGLWLGSITLDEAIEDVAPNFHIKTRMGGKDRCLFIYELEDDNQKGIQFIGTNSPGFYFTPSCFTLRVNNIYFFNYSYDFLFSKHIGFPYAEDVSLTDSPHGNLVFTLKKGSGKISLPLINFKFLKASSYIYQPIIPKLVFENIDETENYYDTDYVKQNLLNNKTGKGDIFYFDRSLHKLSSVDEFQLYSDKQRLNPDSFKNLMAKQTFKVLEHLCQLKFTKHGLTLEQEQTLEKNRLVILHAHRDFMSAL